ncbi:MAG: amphi-Trp domain-containing protein [Thermoleophilia bacterium]|nr:amphi-Trp domain-containing protein [Thermoleophilia bacterium]
MAHHLFDVSERATHDLVAAQLHDLADQIKSGSLDYGAEDWSPQTVILDPMDVDVDLMQKRHEVVLTIRMRWPVK